MHRFLLFVLACSTLPAQTISSPATSPLGVIGGSVFDQDGAAVMDSEVRIVRALGGLRGYFQTLVAGTAKTDDRGSYRISGLGPGTYYVLAAPPAALLAQDRSYRHTYHPGEVRFDSARTLDVQAGAALLGIDIRLAKSNGVAVKGIVLRPGRNSPAAASPQMPFMRLESDDPSISYLPVRRTFNQFEFVSVPPGQYVLSTRIFVGTGEERRAVLDGRQVVEIGASDIPDLKVAVRPTRYCFGSVVSEEGSAVGAAVITVEGRDLRFNARSGNDGRFVLTAVPAGQYRVRIQGPVNRGASLLSVRLGDREVPDGEFEFTGSNGPLVLTVRLAPPPGAR
jgi:hypothetical protein